MPRTPPRITDLSEIEAENFKVRNTNFLLGDTHYDIEPHQTVKELRHDIWVTRNKDLRRVTEEFPTDRPLRVQCAYWMHAVVGKHFFPDANHRTAMALLRKLLRDNGIDPGDWSPDRTRTVRDESHEVRREVPPIHLDTLYTRDKLYLLWWRYFVDVLDDV